MVSGIEGDTLTPVRAVYHIENFVENVRVVEVLRNTSIVSGTSRPTGLTTQRTQQSCVGVQPALFLPRESPSI